MEPPIVVNLHESEYDVYIGRGSPWGNPWRIGKDGDRAWGCAGEAVEGVE